MSRQTYPVPQEVEECGAWLQSELELEPFYEKLTPTKWRLSFENERVKVTFDFKKRGLAFEQVDSTLAVDGKQRRILAKDVEELKRFFHETTKTVEALRVKIAVPPAADVSEAPPKVKNLHGQLAAKLPKAKGVVLRVSRPSRNRWTLGIYLEERSVEFHYARRGQKWVFARPWVRLVIDGEDCSSDVKSIQDALALLMDGSDVKPSDHPATQRTQGPKTRTTSVQVRNTNVIRT